MKKKFRYLNIPAIAVSLVCLVACSSIEAHIIPHNSRVAYTKAELIDLYWEYKDELSEVADIVLTNDPLLQDIIDNKDAERDVSANSHKRYFSEDDWEKVVDLYEKIRALTIERERSGAVSIYFRLQKADKNYINNSLIYFRNEETLEYYQKNRWEEEFEHLDGYWYIRSMIMPR